MSEICAGLGAGSAHPQVRTFWNLAAAMFEAQHHGLLGFDVFTKRVASRLLAQFRLLQRGDSDVSERLARDLLFFCAQAAPAGRGIRVPRLTAVRERLRLRRADADRLLAQRPRPLRSGDRRPRQEARRRRQGSLVGDRRRRDAPPRPACPSSSRWSAIRCAACSRSARSFAAELQTRGRADAGSRRPRRRRRWRWKSRPACSTSRPRSRTATSTSPSTPSASSASASASSLVRQKQPPEPLEPWMEELYRRVSDRQTMGSVVQELRASLSEVEKAIDKFFRNPGDHAVLHRRAGAAQLDARRALGARHGRRRRRRCCACATRSTAWSRPRSIPTRCRPAGVFERLAGNLSRARLHDRHAERAAADGQVALRLRRRRRARWRPVMGRSAAPNPASGAAPVEPRLIEQAQMLAFTSVREDVPVEEVTRDLERLSHEAQAADQPALAAAVLKAQEAFSKAPRSDRRRQRARRAVGSAGRFRRHVDRADRASRRSARRCRWRRWRRSRWSSDFEHDDEMREVFLEEAREVIAAARKRPAPSCSRRARRPRPADDAAPRLPHPQGQLADGRAEGLRRSGLGLRAGLQHPARRAARRRAAADRVRRLGARLPRRLGRGHRRAPRRRSATSAKSRPPPTASRGGRDRPSAAPTSRCRSACRPGCRARADLDLRARAAPAAPRRRAEPEAEDMSFELDLSDASTAGRAGRRRRARRGRRADAGRCLGDVRPLRRRARATRCRRRSTQRRSSIACRRAWSTSISAARPTRRRLIEQPGAERRRRRGRRRCPA